MQEKSDNEPELTTRLEAARDDAIALALQASTQLAQTAFAAFLLCAWAVRMCHLPLEVTAMNRCALAPFSSCRRARCSRSAACRQMT